MRADFIQSHGILVCALGAPFLTSSPSPLAARHRDLPDAPPPAVVAGRRFLAQPLAAAPPVMRTGAPSYAHGAPYYAYGQPYYAYSTAFFFGSKKGLNFDNLAQKKRNLT